MGRWLRCFTSRSNVIDFATLTCVCFSAQLAEIVTLVVLGKTIVAVESETLLQTLELSHVSMGYILLDGSGINLPGEDIPSTNWHGAELVSDTKIVWPGINSD